MQAFKTIILFVVVLVAVFSVAEAHKKFYGPGPGYNQGGPECVCDCGQRQPILPNKPFYGSGGYAQPRPSGAGYGSSGAYAVSGSYGSGTGLTSGGY